MSFNPEIVHRSILQLVAQPDYTPQKPKKILELVGLTSDDSRPLRQLIKSMVQNGELAYGKSHLVSYGLLDICCNHV